MYVKYTSHKKIVKKLLNNSNGKSTYQFHLLVWLPCTTYTNTSINDSPHINHLAYILMKRQ